MISISQRISNNRNPILEAPKPESQPLETEVPRIMSCEEKSDAEQFENSNVEQFEKINYSSDQFEFSSDKFEKIEYPDGLSDDGQLSTGKLRDAKFV